MPWSSLQTAPLAKAKSSAPHGSLRGADDDGSVEGEEAPGELVVRILAGYPRPGLVGVGGRAFECNYDPNPTELYLSVQRKDGEGADERPATHPYEAGTWVSRKESDGKLCWSLLPLHAAII